MVNKATIEAFQDDGIAFLPGLFKPHVKSLRVGVQKNIDEPGPFAAENLKAVSYTHLTLPTKA